ncbi:unnamed protein product [Cladocopium goreaui]|uniref:Uncharacterized protein n=1 Tax=Cladocopium goreaui TaxID=2562237 RepID=A0A9P1BTF4_9DINO|nr:unnamed protein product [Cladocopium goreaui]
MAKCLALAAAAVALFALPSAFVPARQGAPAVSPAVAAGVAAGSMALPAWAYDMPDAQILLARVPGGKRTKELGLVVPIPEEDGLTDGQIAALFVVALVGLIAAVDLAKTLYFGINPTKFKTAKGKGSITPFMKRLIETATEQLYDVVRMRPVRAATQGGAVSCAWTSCPYRDLSVPHLRQWSGNRNPMPGTAGGAELEKMAAASNADSPNSDSSDSEAERDPALPSASSLSWLPAPKKAAQAAGSSQVEIDFESLGRPREKPQVVGSATAWLVQPAVAPQVEEEEQFPVSLLKHPLLRSAGAAGCTEVEAEELESKVSRLVHITAESMQDPDWKMNSLLVGQPGYMRGHAVPKGVSQFDTDQWNQTTLAYPTRTQSRKSHINWLAQDAINKEAEHLDRAAHGKLSKAQTYGRYGW